MPLAPGLVLVPIWSEIIQDKCYATYGNIQAYAERLRQHPILAKTVFSAPRDMLQGFFTAVLQQGLTVP